MQRAHKGQGRPFASAGIQEKAGSYVEPLPYTVRLHGRGTILAIRSVVYNAARDIAPPISACTVN